MTTPPTPSKLNEFNHAEDPARRLLERLGWAYSPRDALAAERGDEREVLLRGRLRAALLRLNEWLNDAQADRVIFELENINAIGMAPAMFSAAPDPILALLSQTMQNIDQAVTHYEDALALCRKAGHRPELAWTYCDYADTLLERNEPGDREQAMSLLDESLAISSELGTRPLMERVLSRREILKA